MNATFKRALILCLFALCLFGLTILGASAADTYATDAEAIADGMVVRVGEEGADGTVYYAALVDAITAAPADTTDPTVIVVIADATHNESDLGVGLRDDVKNKKLLIKSKDGSNFTLTFKGLDEAPQFALFYSQGFDVTFEDVTIVLKNASLAAVSTDSKLTLGKGTTVNFSETAKSIYSIVRLSGAGAQLTVEDGAVINVDGTTKRNSLGDALIYSGGNNTITVKDGATFNIIDSNAIVFSANSVNSTLSIEGGEFNIKKLSQNFYYTNAKVTKVAIKGGTFNVDGLSSMFVLLNGAGAKFAIEGGTFNIKKATTQFFEARKTDSEFVFEGGTFNIASVSGYFCFAKDTAANGTKFTIEGGTFNITNGTQNIFYLNAKGTIAITGGTFNVTKSAKNLITVREATHVQIDGGTFDIGSGMGTTVMSIYGSLGVTGGDYTINAGQVLFYVNSNSNPADGGYYAEVTITGGNFLQKANGNIVQMGSYGIVNVSDESGDLYFENRGSKHTLQTGSSIVTITGGTFLNTGSGHIIYANSSTSRPESNTLVITGGDYTHTGSGYIVYLSGSKSGDILADMMVVIADISNGNFTHQGTGYIFYTTGSARTLFNLTGTVTATHEGDGESYIYYRKSDGTFIADGKDIKLIAKGDNVIFSTAYGNPEFVGHSHVTVKNAYISVESNVVFGSNGGTYGSLINVQLDNDQVALGLLNVQHNTNALIPAIACRLSAEEGKGYYMALTDALSAVEDGDTVCVMQDVTSAQIKVKNKTVTLSGVVREDGSKVTITASKPTSNFIYLEGDCHLIIENIKFYTTGYGIRTANANNHITMNAGAILESTAADGTWIVRNDTPGGVVTINEGAQIIVGDGTVTKTANIFQIAGDTVLNINGGTIYHGATGHIISMSGGIVTINGGTFIAEKTDMFYCTGGEATINGGSFYQHAGSVLYIAGASKWEINNGYFLADAAGSAAASHARTPYFFYKDNADASIFINSGVYLMQDRQYVYYTTGEADGVLCYPVSSLEFVENDDTLVNVGEKEYYYMSFSSGSPVVPSLDADAKVSMTEGNEGLLFESTLPAHVYAALETYAKSLAGLGNTYELAFGTLIAPIADLKNAEAFTVEALDAAGVVYANVACEPEFDEEGNLTLEAVLTNIAEEDYAKLYTAVPYVIVYTDAVTEVLYGAYSTGEAATLSFVATLWLYDVTDVIVGDYVHESVLVPYAYSRFTKEEQEILKSYLVHTHINNYKGVCNICGRDCVVELAVDTATKISMKYENVYSYKLTLEAGITYFFNLTENVANLTLYNAEGDRLTIDGNGNFACTADGTYYLKATPAKVGKATLSVDHVHVTDHKGFCEICEQSFLQTIQPETLNDVKFQKGEGYYFAIELAGGVKYMVLTVNGTFTVYSEQGEELPVEQSTVMIPEDGTYYIVVKAAIKGQGMIRVDHVHTYDHTGVCVKKDCDDSVSVKINGIYVDKTVNVKADNDYYFNVKLEAGKAYYVNFSVGVGIWSLYDAEGNVLEEVGGVYDITVTGTYYIVVKAQVAGKTVITVGAQHTCEYNYRGKCGICGTETGRTLAVDGSANLSTTGAKTFYYNVADLTAGATYTVMLSGSTVPVLVYDASGNAVTLTEGAFVPAASGTYYLVVDATEGITATLAIYKTADAPNP